MRIAVLALEGVWDTALALTIDALGAANGLSNRLMGGTPRFDVSVVGVRRTVRSGRGMDVPVKPITPDLRPDWVIVPGLNTIMPGVLLAALARPDTSKAVAQLLQWRQAGVQLAAACVGTFLLAEAGLLDDLEATTNWSLAPLFRQRYPKVRLKESRMLIAADGIVTAGAAMGHLDLALWLVRQASPELSNTVSRYLLADLRSTQAAYIIPSHLAHADPLITHFERWARGHLKEGFSLEAAAGALSTTSRTLQRRCNEILGKSPLAYFQDLRVEHAQSLLRGSGLDIHAIAAEVGYVDGATLRTLLRERLGRGVRELRAELL
ncbi:GlxA family transcriptional regulator [Methylocapsa sp. S129]|uniref:GlxA family transcriptional regulator n=1 Tax=Methylocapsa sp. S129 TaxID=1641869 RepID=UPI00131E9B3B|nr:helix-turn-helix domain-containing protein [Methylocapsa sp. S129]